MRSDYEILGISRDADQNEIKRAYFRQLRQHPPETDPEGFQQLRAAYERLKRSDLQGDGPVFPPLQSKLSRLFLEQIDKCLSEGLYQYGQATALEACKRFPEEQIFWYRLVELQRKCGNTGKAVRNAEKLLAMSPENRWYHRALALASYDRGFWKKAVNSCKRAYDLGCRDLEFVLIYGMLAAEYSRPDLSLGALMELARTKKVWKQDEQEEHRQLFTLMIANLGEIPELDEEIAELYLKYIQDCREAVIRESDPVSLAGLCKVAEMYRLQMHDRPDSRDRLRRCLETAKDISEDVKDEYLRKTLKLLIRNMYLDIVSQDDRIPESLKALFVVLCSPDYPDTGGSSFALLDTRLCMIEERQEILGCVSLVKQEYADFYRLSEKYLTELDQDEKETAILKMKLQKTYAKQAQYYNDSMYLQKYPAEREKIFGVLVASGEKPYMREHRKIGRNDPCPCGSGRKYKQCCMGKGIFE